MMENSDELVIKASRIIEILKDDKSVCIAITGEWGVGKTYFWKNYIQNKIEKTKICFWKKLTKKYRKDKVVYITLFGKEHYSQILEEIVMQVCERHNKFAKNATNVISALAKLANVNINPDALFSTLKKENFEKTIICFDDIERKSDKLSIKDFMGLVAHLRDIKECKVVIVLNKDIIEKSKQNEHKEQNNDFSDFQKYKEKCVNYEFTINGYTQVASFILKDEFKDIKNSRDKEILINLGSKCYVVEFNMNLRHLFQGIENVRYFYKKCDFRQFYEKENEDLFYKTFEMFFEEIWLAEYNLTKKLDDETKYSFAKSCVNYYIGNDYSLSDDDIKEICNYFGNVLQDRHFAGLETLVRNYPRTNMSDEEYAQSIEKYIAKIEKSALERNCKHYSFDYYENIFKDYEKIKGRKLDDEIRVRKVYIDFYIYEQGEAMYDKSTSTYELPNIEKIINNKELKGYYNKQIKEITDKTTLSRWLNGKWWKNIKGSFSARYIGYYNNFKVDDISNEFKTNEQFCKAFFEFFIYTQNALVDKENNLFKAFMIFLEDKNYALRKEKLMIHLKNNRNCSLVKLFGK